MTSPSANYKKYKMLKVNMGCSAIYYSTRLRAAPVFTGPFREHKRTVVDVYPFPSASSVSVALLKLVNFNQFFKTCLFFLVHF